MANRFPLFVEPVSQTVREIPVGDNLDLSGCNIAVNNSSDVLTLPTTTDTLVGRATTDTLSNKTLSSPVLTTPRLLDASADHRYIFVVSELIADRNITIPVLSSDDTFVFKDAAQTLTNKTLTNPTINASGGTLVLPQATEPAQSADGSIVWDSDSELLTIGTGTGLKTIVDTNSTQTLSGKTLSNLVLSGTLTANGSVGTDGYLLKSTGTGVEWVASSAAITITNDTSTDDTFYPALIDSTSGTLVSVKVSNTKLSFNPSTGILSATKFATDSLAKANGDEMLFVPKYNAQVATGDGTTTGFTLNNSVTNEQELLITVGGVPQTPGVGYSYTATGTTLTFFEAPNPGDRIVIRYLIYKVR